jgi:hypothetical protein
MGDSVLASILAFFTASFVVGLELVSSEYPTTFFTLCKEWALYLYCGIYGFLSFMTVLFFEKLVNSGAVVVQGPGLSSPYVRALLVGLSVRAFLHLNVYTVRVGLQSTSVGLETFVQLFEGPLLRTMALREYNGVMEYLEPYVQSYTDLTVARETAKRSLPSSFDSREIAALEKDLDEADEVGQVLALVLRNLGRRTLERVFPLPASPSEADGTGDHE